MRSSVVRIARVGRQVAVLCGVAGLLSCAPGEPIEGNLSPAPDIVALHLAPDEITLDVNGATDFGTSVELSDGSTLPTQGAGLTTTGGTITADGGYVAAGRAGDYLVVAVLGSLADTSVVHVEGTEANLIRLSIDPGSAALLPGGTQRFATSGVFSDSSIVPLTVDYSATGGSINSSGVYTAGQIPGLFQVIGSLKGGELADTATVEIGQAPANLVRVEVSPPTATLNFGQAFQFTAGGRLSDSTLVSLPVTWTATGGTVSATGNYTAGTTAGNSFRVIARASNGMADTSSIRVQAASITALNLTPDIADLQTGQTQQFTATATLSNGTVQQNPSVTYTFTGGLMTQGGLYTAGLIPGTYQVIARTSNGVADTSTVNISLAVLTAINVGPINTTIQTGQSAQFVATGVLSNNGVQPNPDVQWSATGGSVTSSGLYTAGTTPGTFQVRASNVLSALAGTASVTVIAAPPANMFFNSAEAGCGTDANVLLCDDFESGTWYTKDCDQANGSGGLLQTHGWCGTIFNAGGLSAGTAKCGNLGVKSNCVATTGIINGTTGNMADHGLAVNGSTEIWVRFYTKPLSGYQFGAEKMLTFNDGQPGGAGIRFGNLSWNCGGNTQSTGNITMGFPPPMDVCQTQNAGNNITITAGNWYFYEVHYKLSSPGSSNGVFELWIDNCGPSGTSCPATPTLRLRRTDVNNARTSSEAIRVLWFEAWSNPTSEGERYWDQIKVSKAGPIGFLP